MESLDMMRGRACRMRDASYAGVLHNGTKPRLKSWNLIRGRLLRDAELVRHEAERFSRRAFLMLHFSARSSRSLTCFSFRLFSQGKNIDYFFKIFDKNRTLLWRRYAIMYPTQDDGCNQENFSLVLHFSA